MYHTPYTEQSLAPEGFNLAEPYDIAEQVYLNFSHKLGPDATETLGKRAKLVEELRVALAERESRYGLEHVETMEFAARLIPLLLLQGEAHAAKILEERYNASLAPLQNIMELAQRRQQGSALVLLKALLDERTRSLGPGHRHTLRAWQMIASVTGASGALDKAIDLQVTVIGMKAHHLGAYDLDTLSGMQNLAFLLQLQGDRAAAHSVMGEVATHRTRLLGTTHPETQSALALREQYASEPPSVDGP